jgi:hypothetical protein
MRVRTGSVLRVGAALAGLLGTFAVTTPAWADTTTLSISYKAAAYQVGPSGSVPAVSVPAAEGSASSDTSQPASVPTVAPGQPLTVAVTIDAAHPVNEGTIAFQLDNTVLATVNVTAQTVLIPASLPGRVVGGVLQPTGPARSASATTVGGASYTFKVPAGNHNLTVRYSGGVHFASNIYARSILSQAHTTLDVSCGCQQNGQSAACVASGTPKSPAQKLVCKSNVYAEIMPPNFAGPIWGPGPAGSVAFNIQGIGIVSAPASGVGTTAVVATGSASVPSVAATYPVGTSFTPADPSQASASTGPSTSVQVAYP